MIGNAADIAPRRTAAEGLSELPRRHFVRTIVKDRATRRPRPTWLAGRHSGRS